MQEVLHAKVTRQGAGAGFKGRQTGGTNQAITGAETG